MQQLVGWCTAAVWPLLGVGDNLGVTAVCCNWPHHLPLYFIVGVNGQDKVSLAAAEVIATQAAADDLSFAPGFTSLGCA